MGPQPVENGGMRMIYCDQAATALDRPPQVRAAVLSALEGLGNPGRSIHAPALNAARLIYGARQETAALLAAPDPLRVAFTSGATESFHLVLGGLITPADHVITTVLEHNAVLRPLYQIGCPLSFLDCDEEGVLQAQMLPTLLRPNTRFLVCTHGSNVLGTVTDPRPFQDFCRRHQLTLIWDVSETLGSRPLSGDMGDFLCFTGHKALLGPQGTGGIYVHRPRPLRLVKTGGSGSDSFAPHQPLSLPDCFEAGTPNTPGIAGLRAGIAFLRERGLPQTAAQLAALRAQFLAGIRDLPGLRIYGPQGQDHGQGQTYGPGQDHGQGQTYGPGQDHGQGQTYGLGQDQGQAQGQAPLPIVSLNIRDLPSGELCARLWADWGIATRPGSHCAPLVHRRFHTREQGMLRFSFGLFNTSRDVEIAVDALTALCR